MADVTTFDELDPALVAESLDLLKSMMAGEFPTMDLSPASAFTQNILRPAALLHAVNQTNWDRRKDSLSMRQLALDPTLGDDEAVDNLASNWNISRRTGATAAGTALLVFSSSSFVAIPTSMTFTANGVIFRPVRVFAAVPDSSSALSADYKVMTRRSDGSYAITVTLQADTAGAAGNIGDATVLEVDPTPSTLTQATAFGDFVGGSDDEDTEALIERLQSGITSTGSGGRAGIRGLLQQAFPQITDVSVIGAGDPEMLRGSHTGLGVKGLGYADVYVRIGERAQRLSLTLEATLLNATTAQWQLTFDRDDYPGLYGIERVVAADNATPLGTDAGLELTVVRGADTSEIAGVDFTPLMAGDESNFTRYQTMVVTFNDIDSGTAGLSVGDTRDYRVDAIYMPELASVNDWLLSRERRPWGGDYLVKAAVPCMVSVSMTILRHLADPDLESDTETLASIRNAVAAAVNAVNFSEGRLASSVVLNAAQQFLTGRTRVQTPLDLRGKLFLPDGTSGWIFDRDALIAPDRPTLMCTSRTVAFMCDPSQVLITVIDNDAAPV